MGEQKDEIRLIEVVIVFDGIVDDDGEEDDCAADDAIDESIGQFGQPGFLIQGFIGTHQGIEDKPAQGDGRRTQPEAGGQEEPVIDKNRFGKQDPAAEMENVGRQECGDIIANDIPKDVDRVWFFSCRHT